MFLISLFSIVNENEREGIISEAIWRLEEKLFKDGILYVDYVHLRMKAVKERPSKGEEAGDSGSVKPAQASEKNGGTSPPMPCG